MMRLEEMRFQMVSGSRGSHFQDFYHGRGKLNSEHACAPASLD
jgi:hypothetical protein